MRETRTASATGACLLDEMPEEPKGMGFDGWLVVLRAFTVLFAGLLIVSLAAVI